MLILEAIQLVLRAGWACWGRQVMEVLGPTHFWSTKMPMMRLKEIRSAVTHMRQYSSGGCGEMAQDQLPARAHIDWRATDWGTPYKEG